MANHNNYAQSIELNLLLMYSIFCFEYNIEHVKIYNDKLMQNGFIERLYNNYKHGVLDMLIFKSLNK